MNDATRFAIFVGCAALSGCAQFGRLPSGERLERIKASPNCRDGAFQNQIDTPRITTRTRGPGIFFKLLLEKRPKDIKPPSPIPSRKTDLRSLDAGEDVLVWFGHSSYFIQLGGKRFLVDPILTAHASPFPGVSVAFPGSTVYAPDDLPFIDYLVITHDHFDHLDRASVLALEGDWYDSFDLGEGLSLTILPSRRFSGRTFRANPSLWASYDLRSPSLKLYLGGDSGYGPHFGTIGKSRGPYDLAILENGQYSLDWRNIHMFPDDTLQAAKDLGARRLLPVHDSKLALSRHAWNEPMARLRELDTEGMAMSPEIGGKVGLRDREPSFAPWWEGLR